MNEFFSSPYFMLVAVIVAFLVGSLQIKQYMAFRKKVQEHVAETGETVQRSSLSTFQRISPMIPVGICAVTAVVILVKPQVVDDPPAYLALLAILIILFSTSFFTVGMSQQLNYTETGFFLKDRFVAFDELQKLSYGSRKPDSVLLKNGTEYQVTRSQLRALEALRESKAFKLPSKKKK